MRGWQKKVGRTHAFNRNEWCLEEEGMDKGVMLNIAKARWIYHCERVKMDKKTEKETENDDTDEQTEQTDDNSDNTDMSETDR